MIVRRMYVVELIFDCPNISYYEAVKHNCLLNNHFVSVYPEDILA